MSITQSPEVVRPAAGVRPRSRRTRAWVITGMLLVFMLINFADKAALGLAGTRITHDLGLSASRYGLLASAFFFLFSVGALAVGFLADRIPTKWVILGMAAIWSITQVPLIGTVGFGMLLASRIVLGAAEGPAFPVATHAVHKWFRNADRSLPSAILIVGAPLGVILGAPALTWVIVHHGWHAAFLLLAVVGAVWCVLWLVLGREGHDEDTLVPDAGPADAVRIPYWRILASGTWLASVTAGFAVYWALALLVAWLPQYLEKELGYSATVTGYLIMVPWTVGALGQLGQGLVSDRLMRHGMSSRAARGILGGVCVIVAGVAMLGFVLAPAGWPKMVFMAIGFNFGAAIFAVSQTVCAEVAPVRQRGGVLGSYAAVYATSGIVAPYLTGKLIDALGSGHAYQVTFLISAMLLLVGGVLATLFIRPERDALRLRAVAAKREAVTA
jgi:MFS family permease